MKFTVDVFNPSKSGLLQLLTPVGGSPIFFRSISVVPWFLWCSILLHDQIFEVCWWYYFCNFITVYSCTVNSQAEHFWNIVDVVLFQIFKVTVFLVTPCFSHVDCLFLLSLIVYGTSYVCVVFVTLGMWYCLWEVSMVRYGVVLIAIPMCCLLLCKLLTLCCPLLSIVVEKIIYLSFCGMR